MFILDNVNVDLIGACNDYGLAVLLNVIKRFLNIIQIVGPVLAVISLVVIFVKMISNPEEKKMKNAIKNCLIALVMLFVIPMIVNLVMQLFDDKFTISACWNEAEQIVSNSDEKNEYKDDYDKNKSNVIVKEEEYEV